MADLTWRINRIRAEAPIYLFFDWAGANVLRQPHPHQIRCPFVLYHAHGDQSASARIYPGTNTMFCFTEYKSRDLIDCVSEHFSLSLPEAVRYIEQRCGWSSTSVEKVAALVVQASQPSRPVRIRPTPSIVEQRVAEAVQKILPYLTLQERVSFSDLVTYIWDCYHEQGLDSGDVEAQVDWERNSLALLHRELTLLFQLREPVGETDAKPG